MDRPSRQCRPSQKMLENLSQSPRKRRHIPESSDSEMEIPEKPQIIHENEQVPGGKLFTFQARKQCEVPKTPHATRNQLKREIQAKLEEDFSDFSDSGSEYVASEETASSSEEEVTPILKNSAQIQRPQVRKNTKYTIKTEDYFSNHATSKIITSNHTLDKLETPRLPQDQLCKMISNLKVSPNHLKSIEKLNNSNENLFTKWMLLMNEGINILVYGLGSKLETLNKFYEKCLKKEPTIVVNGFFPSLLIKEILDGIVLNILELQENPSNIYESCDLIQKEFSFIPNTHLYIILHNIDMMRAGKSQAVFARLAAVPNIHLIASIDHINAPLIWDHSKLSKLNFTWWDITNFQSYINETSFEGSMMVQRSGSLALTSLRNVFLSLTSNSKGIYIILVKYQLENGKKQYYQGLSFKELYSLSREAFLVSSDLALRAQLQEFVDHKMAKYRRSADGAENLIIPITNTILQQFLNEQ